MNKCNSSLHVNSVQNQFKIGRIAMRHVFDKGCVSYVCPHQTILEIPRNYCFFCEVKIKGSDDLLLYLRGADAVPKLFS